MQPAVNLSCDETVLPPNRLLDALHEVELFKGLPDSVLHHFVEKAVPGTAQKGRVLFLHGDAADHFFIILSGWVKLFRETLEGQEAVIDVLHSGHIFGETSLPNDRYSVSAQIVEDCRYLVLPNSLLRYYLEKDSRMAMNLLSHTAKSHRAYLHEIEHLNAQTAPQRIGCFLLRLCPENTTGEVQLNLPYDKTLIAARLGMKPETFSRALAKLKAETNLKITGAAVTIQSVELLMQYTCNHCSTQFPCDDLG